MSRRMHRAREATSGPSRLARVPWIGVIAAVAVVAVIAVSVGAIQARRPQLASPQSSAATLAAAGTLGSTATALEPATVEVPDVVGMRGEDARVVLAATGLSVTVHSPDASSAADDEEGFVVASQDPDAGVIVGENAGVAIALSASRSPKNPGTTPSPKKRATAGFVVCIDPGHQSQGDSSPEPIGPGSSKTRPRVMSGATGVRTGIPEYEIALQISMNLKARLEAEGVKVIMTRTTNDVSISNSERAAVANKADADLFVRIHGDGNPDASASGVSTLFPVSNRWTRAFAGDSREAARIIQSSVVRSTGAVDRGIIARSDLAGFNWAKVPCVLVECGFLSNPVEDRLLAGPAHQDKVATGIAEGVLAYLKSL